MSIKKFAFPEIKFGLLRVIIGGILFEFDNITLAVTISSFVITIELDLLLCAESELLISLLLLRKSTSLYVLTKEISIKGGVVLSLFLGRGLLFL